MKLVVGLGNPGRIYRYTRHNAGFLAIESLAKEYGIKMKEKVYGSLAGLGRIKGEEVLLLEPVTYMNLSGKAVAEALRAEKVGLDGLFVICDDVNLRLGTVRMRLKGSAGGHKGLTSIIEELGAGEFARLRIGIADEVLKGDITGFVLAPFKKKELHKIRQVIDIACDTVTLWLAEGAEAAMTVCNVRNRTYA